MSNRMSLDEAKLVLRHRGFMVSGNSHKGYRAFKDGVDHTTLVTGRGIVKFAKEVLLEEYDRNHRAVEELKKGNEVTYGEIDLEIMAEMMATWGPGTTVVNVVTGKTVVL